MNRFTWVLAVLLPFHLTAQDTTVAVPGKPVQAFNSEKAINANTTEMTGHGKMAFRVTHHFGDIASKIGGLKNFFGLDNAVDFRIGLTFGLGKNFDLGVSRVKGAFLRQQQWELAMKWKWMQQTENGNPFSIALFANHVVATNTASTFSNRENSYKGFSERSSNALQLIIAKRMGNVTLQLNPTFITRGYTVSYDQKSIFALGGAIRIPIIRDRLNFLSDYFYCFRKQAVKDSFRLKDNIGFYNPLGFGIEFLTSGHSFRMNFANNQEILENRFIPRTVSSWGAGRFRWCFTIVRNFRLFTPKK